MFTPKAEIDDVEDAANTPFVVVNILKDELFYPDDRLSEWIIPPVRPMAGLRKPPRDTKKKDSTGGDPENSVTEDNIMVKSIPGGF